MFFFFDVRNGWMRGSEAFCWVDDVYFLSRSGLRVGDLLKVIDERVDLIKFTSLSFLMYLRFFKNYIAKKYRGGGDSWGSCGSMWNWFILSSLTRLCWNYFGMENNFDEVFRNFYLHRIKDSKGFFSKDSIKLGNSSFRNSTKNVNFVLVFQNIEISSNKEGFGTVCLRHHFQYNYFIYFWINLTSLLRWKCLKSATIFQIFENFFVRNEFQWSKNVRKTFPKQKCSQNFSCFFPNKRGFIDKMANNCMSFHGTICSYENVSRFWNQSLIFKISAQSFNSPIYSLKKVVLRIWF